MAQPAVKLYALSTCIHCRHTKEFLDKNNIKYDLTYVDQAQGPERDAVMEEVMKYNPRCSFPTIVINNGEKVIIGFKPDEIKQAVEQ